MDTKTKALALLGVALVLGSAFVIANGTSVAEAKPGANKAWRLLAGIRRVGAYVYRNGEPATVTGTVIGHLGPVMGLRVDGAKQPVIMPPKWTLNGDTVAFRRVVEAFNGKEVTVTGLRVVRENAKIKRVYLAESITIGGITATAILPKNK